MQKQEVCTVSSIELLLTSIGHNMVFISITILLEIPYAKFSIECSTCQLFIDFYESGIL